MKEIKNVLFAFTADYKEVFSGISDIEEVAFNALSFVWNPSEEAKVNKHHDQARMQRYLYITWLHKAISPKREEAEQVEDLEKKKRRGKVEERGEERRSGKGGRGGIPEMCLALRLLSPQQVEGRDEAALRPEGAEVGPLNLLQVERRNYQRIHPQ